MIDEIEIRHLGVIDHTCLRPGPGLTVVTGETGAGKTMVLTSIALLMGRKADSGIVRHGEDVCQVDGIFIEPPAGPAHAIVAEAGGMTEDDAIMIGRTVPVSGRSRAYAGGRAVPAGVLAEIGAHLVTVHGQADQMVLRQSQAQRELLDEAGGETHARVLADYRDAWQAWSAAHGELEEFRAGEAGRALERERLEQGLEVLAALDPQAHEDDDLVVEIERMANTEDLRVAATTAHDLLSRGDDGLDCLSALGEAERALTHAAGMDTQLGEWAGMIDECGTVLQDVAASLASYLDDLSADPRLLAAKQQRLADLRRGMRPYASSVDEFLAWGEQAAQRVAEMTAPEYSLDALDAAEQETRAARDAAARALHDSRVAVASALESAAREELAGLAMSDAGFVITVEDAPLTSTGADAVTFGLTDAAGRVRGIGQGASGGELSRIMLALEAALVDRYQPLGRPTLIFDEVDAGIGGATASAVGARLARLAERHQVIVVTHLAQVAAYASTHVVVAREGDTTHVREVAGDERVSEIARMLAGDSDSEAARIHAAELLSSHSVA